MAYLDPEQYYETDGSKQDWLTSQIEGYPAHLFQSDAIRTEAEELAILDDQVALEDDVEDLDAE